MKKATLVIGASDNPQRYSYLAIHLLKQYGYPVYALGNKKGYIEETPITTDKINFPEVDTVTLYINPTIQKEYIDYIYSLSPRRIIFNPGTENASFFEEATKKGIHCEEACTLVLLRTDQY